MAEYKTVEGHPIVRDGEYETRDGSKARILGFEENFRNHPVIGLVNQADVTKWRRTGGNCNYEQYDLMRPWKDKLKITLLEIRTCQECGHEEKTTTIIEKPDATERYAGEELDGR